MDEIRRASQRVSFNRLSVCHRRDLFRCEGQRVGDFYWGGPGQNRAGQKDRTTETRDRELWYVSLEDNGCLSAQVITSADSRCEPVLTLNTATKSLTIQTLARGQSQPATAR